MPSSSSFGPIPTSARGVPSRPAARMQPGMAGLFGAERQQLVVGVFAPTAAETAAGRRACRIAVEPFDDAAIEGADLGLIARQPAIELGEPGALVEIRQPVLARPAVHAFAQQRNDADLMPGPTGRAPLAAAR